MKTNFDEWKLAYFPILIPYYNKFTSMFKEEIPPTMGDFIYYCFLNTKKTYNHTRSRSEAYITYF